MDASLMLQNIKYAGFDIVSSSFKDNTSDDGGFLRSRSRRLNFLRGVMMMVPVGSGLGFRHR